MSMNTPTPHNAAKKGDFARTVLMPGDPRRAEFIAKNFITDARMVNNVRGICGFTGTYDGVPVSVMASGMGMPSMGIYSYELFEAYDVQNIIRIGSIGALQTEINVRDIIIGMGACTDSNYAAQYGLGGTFAPIASYDILETAVQTARDMELHVHVGNILSSDLFYKANPEVDEKWRGMGILGIEMEAAALYMNAAKLGRRALAICTVSDNIITGESLSAEERETSFTEMMRLALTTATTLDAVHTLEDINNARK